MPKRRFDSDDDDDDSGDEGRNCHLITAESKRLEAAQTKLQQLLDMKAELENELERKLDKLQGVHRHIMSLECKVEKMVSNHGANCEERLKHELEVIVDERTKAEQGVMQAQKKLDEKLKELNNCKEAAEGDK